LTADVPVASPALTTELLQKTRRRLAGPRNLAAWPGGIRGLLQRIGQIAAEE
jgi:hypothetical protein